MNLLGGIVGRKVQTLEQQQTVQTCYNILLLLFSKKKCISTVEIFRCLNRVQFVQLAHNFDNENRQCIDK